MSCILTLATIRAVSAHCFIQAESAPWDEPIPTAVIVAGPAVRQ